MAGYNWSSVTGEFVRNHPDDHARWLRLGVGGKKGVVPLSGGEPDSVVAQGVRWASRVTTIGLEFALPPALGHWLDRRWGTGAILTIVGVLLGFGGGLLHLLAIAREETKPPRRPGSQDDLPSEGTRP